MLKKGEKGTFCKLDLENVYDRVNWTFFDYMLGRMGFDIRWISINFKQIIGGLFL